MLLEFRKRYNRDPDYEQRNEDIEKLKTIAAEIIALYNFPNLNLDDVYELIYGELTPVCAILGGIIAQEVIKAVSHKEATINNIFLFDPVSYSGKELTIGA